MAIDDFEVSSAAHPQDNVVPGLVNAPTIFIGPSAKTAASGELWFAVSCNDSNYGGCVVLASNEGEDYSRIGIIRGSATHGVLIAALADVAGLDETSVLSVDLSQSHGILEGVKQATVDVYDSLCYVGGELLAYREADLTGVDLYDLSYLRRGLYGTTPGAASGSDFALLNDAILKWRFNRQAVGKTLYFKFQAFNLVQAGYQDLADCVEYTFHIAADGGVKALLSDLLAATVGKEDTANKVTAWSVTPTDSNYPSEKLVKNALDSKLDASVYNEHFKGKYPTLVALQAAYPTAAVGDYGQVDIGAGHDVVNYNWDAEDGWVIGSSGSGATNTDMLPEGSSNFYHTDYRVQHTVLSDFVDPGTTGSVDNTLTVVEAIQNLWGNYVDSLNYFLPGGAATTKYLTGDSFGVAGWVVLSTLRVPEYPGGGQYFTAARVLATVLTGLSLATTAVIAATDTVLGALGKLQAQITAQKIPSGGTANQVLSKIDGTAYNTQWVTPSSGSSIILGYAIFNMNFQNTTGSTTVLTYVQSTSNWSNLSGFTPPPSSSSSPANNHGVFILPAGTFIIKATGQLTNGGINFNFVIADHNMSTIVSACLHQKVQQGATPTSSVPTNITGSFLLTLSGPTNLYINGNGTGDGTVSGTSFNTSSSACWLVFEILKVA